MVFLQKNTPQVITVTIKSTYRDSKGIVKIDGRESVRFSIKKGVKEEDSLSPLFFIIYMVEYEDNLG